ncbi:reverse transcriptase [Gossypium australe]|uniref:Reverse transcriptase n=1 Tax=Gossypium australe TaxID=47621 RepID=A0A5B6VT64_9ROSI|nr:reverse transcriptase [Gossypium australe]
MGQNCILQGITLIGLPPHRLQDHRLPLIDESKVVKVRPYKYPAVQKTEIKKLVQEMLHAGIIKDNNSSFASSMVMVKKKYVSWRLCIDYKQLNQLTIKDRFPIPVIEELLDVLGQTIFFSKLDLCSSYHQIRMWE